MIKIIYTGEAETRAGKSVFGATVRKILENDPKAAYLDADLMNSIGTKGIDEEFPNQAFQCGIQEANMMGVAGGLSAAGMKPIAHTFGAFASRRAFDQVFISIAYAQNSAVIIGSDPGVTAAYNGGTHMPFEDICLYRSIPDATVLEFTDCAMLESVLPELVNRKGLTYCRLNRKNATAVYEPGSTFEIGKGIILKDGTDVTIVATGLLVNQAMKASEELAKEGISAAVIDMWTIKPLDIELIDRYAQKTGAFVTAENGNIVGGLGAAVATHLAETKPMPVMRVGVHDRFGQVGTPDYLSEVYGLTAEEIVKSAKKAIALK